MAEPPEKTGNHGRDVSWSTAVLRTTENGVQTGRRATELVWLAEVESGFDPKARSPIGAVGLFQLMPDTAELMGLTGHFLGTSAGSGKERTQQRAISEISVRKIPRLASDAGCVQSRRRNAGPPAVGETQNAIVRCHRPGFARRNPVVRPKVEATIQRREGIALVDLKPAA